MKKFTWSTIQDIHVFQSINLLLKDDQDLLDFLFHPMKAKLNADPQWLINEAGCFSHGEQLLVRAAIDLWSSEGHCNLGEIISVLDYGRMLNFLNALCHIRDINEDLIDRLDDKLTLGHKRKKYREADISTD